MNNESFEASECLFLVAIKQEKMAILPFIKNFLMQKLISYPERDGVSSHGSGEARSGDQVTIAVPEVLHLGWGH